MNELTQDNTLNEFSRILNLDLVEKKATVKVIEATKEECQLLAKRFSIVGVVSLSAKCTLNRRKQKEVGDFLLRVDMAAKIVQSCVMTLNDVHESINEKFSIILQKAPQKVDKNDENVEVSFDIDDDDIELIENKDVDVGEYVAEYLSLYMDTYPRLSGAEGEELGYKVLKEDEIKEELKTKNPFAVLKDLKHNT